MIDAKRLAELMEPGKLRNLAECLESLREDVSNADSLQNLKRDALDETAAVLREVAGRAEAKVRNSVPAKDGDHNIDGLRVMAGMIDKKRRTPSKVGGTDKVIEVDPEWRGHDDSPYLSIDEGCPVRTFVTEADDDWGRHYCGVDGGLCRYPIEAPPETCRLVKGRIIIQAKAKP